MASGHELAVSIFGVGDAGWFCDGRGGAMAIEFCGLGARALGVVCMLSALAPVACNLI